MQQISTSFGLGPSVSFTDVNVGSCIVLYSETSFTVLLLSSQCGATAERFDFRPKGPDSKLA